MDRYSGRSGPLVIEFALLAVVLVAIVVVAVWRLRPRDMEVLDSESAQTPLSEAIERPPNLLDIARSELNPEFRESLAALVMRDRWRGAESPDLDELRRIVTEWTGQSTPEGPTAKDGHTEPAANPMETFVSKVSVAAGPGLVEIRLRRGSDIDVLLRRPPQGARRPFSLS